MVFVVWMSIGVSDYQLWSEKGKITNHWQCIRRIGRNDASEWKFSCQIWSNRRVTVLQNRSSFNPNKERNASQSIMHRSFYCIYGCVAIGQLDSAVWHLGNIMLGNNGFYHSGENIFSCTTYLGIIEDWQVFYNGSATFQKDNVPCHIV